MNTHRLLLSGLTVGSLIFLTEVPSASANLKACGGIFVDADASCEYRETEQCKTTCTTEAVQTSCVARIYTSCEGGCTATASASCETSCGQVCTNDCVAPTPQPEPPSCYDLCLADCSGNCADGGGPNTCCGHGCKYRCEEKCENAPPPPPAPTVETCTPTCTSACSGSCTAQANVECQTECQTSEITECETELVETCETECEDNGGAIFCDGQFVNAANKKSCADELNAKFDFDIDVKGSVKATVNNTKKKADAACAVGNVGESTGGAGTALGLALFGGVLALRSRKRRAHKQD